MRKLVRRVRSYLFGVAALGAHGVKACADKFRGVAPEVMPNYTELEEGLFLGGQCAAAPPGVSAVLSVTLTPDSFSTEKYEWQPLHAGNAPTMEWIERQVKFIDRCRKEGRGVFVHCDAGMDRSAMVVIAYFMWRDRISRDAASDRVQRKRTIRVNPAFMALLAKWERWLQEKL